MNSNRIIDPIAQEFNSIPFVKVKTFYDKIRYLSSEHTEHIRSGLNKRHLAQYDEAVSCVREDRVPNKDSFKPTPSGQVKHKRIRKPITLKSIKIY